MAEPTLDEARQEIARHVIARALERGRDHLAATSTDVILLRAASRFATVAAATVERGGRLFACGNGGSLADAMHFASEWSGRFREDRRAFPATAFADPIAISCIANDYGWDAVFARQVEAHTQAGDLLLSISTSGDSENVVRAARTARARGVFTVGLLGRGGGKLAADVDLAIVAPEADTADAVQGVHVQVIHAVIEAAEALLAERA